MKEASRDVRDYSIKELRAICQSTAPNPTKETLTGRFCRIFAIYATKAFLYTPVTPNQLNVLVIVLFLASAGVYFGSYYITLLGPVLYFLSIVVDGSDGEVARFKKMTNSFAGAYNEPVSHDVQYGLFFFLLSVALFLQGASSYILVAGAVASISKLLYRLLQLRFWYAVYAGTDQVRSETQNTADQKRNFVIRLFNFVNQNVFSFTGILIPLILATVFRMVDILIYFYAIGFLLLYVALFFKQIRHILKKKLV